MTADQLREAMDTLEITTRDLSDLTGKTQRAVQLWLAGKVAIPFHVAFVVDALANGALNPFWLHAYLKEKANEQSR